MSIDLAALAKRAGGKFDGVNALIPGPGHSSADRSLSVSIGDNGRVIWFSFAGDDAAATAAHLKSLGVDVSSARVSSEALRVSERAGQAKANANTNTRYAIQLWREGIPIEGTIAARYLHSRGIDPPYPPSLRFHPRCKDGPFYHPTLIAARTMLDAVGDVHSVQRIYLRRDGHGKANTEDAKKTLGACKGGGVVLGEIGDELLIAEGVETALSASAMFNNMPAVATTGAEFYRGLIVPERVRRVVIAADNDEPGLRAAEALAARERKEGRDVRVETPPPAFKDFNDFANGKERSVDALRSFRGGRPPHGI